MRAALAAVVRQMKDGVDRLSGEMKAEVEVFASLRMYTSSATHFNLPIFCRESCRLEG
jgi:hypothetical protein